MKQTSFCCNEIYVCNNLNTLFSLSISFVYRCYASNNKLIFSLMTSERFINSAYYKYYNTLVYLQ